MTAAAIGTVALLLGFWAIGRWSARDQERAIQQAVHLSIPNGYTLTEAGHVAAATIDALRAGKLPIGYRVHRHPSGVPLVEIVCEGDAVAEAERFLEDAS